MFSANKLTHFIRSIIYSCCLIILCFLFLLSIFTTCSIGADITSNTTIFYKQDYPIIHLFSIILLLYLIYLFKKIELSEKTCQKILKSAMIIWAVIASLWVLFYLKDPSYDSDSKHVLDAAHQMRNYNFTSFTRGNYLYRWAGNRGLTLCFYLLSFLIGTDNLTVLRLINVLSILSVFYLLYKITRFLFQSSKTAYVLQIIGCIFFIPALLYTTFVYGDIFGFALAVAAIYAETQYLSGHKLKWSFLFSILIAFAIMVKMNELIILIAMICILIYDSISTKEWKKGLLCFLMLAIFTISFHTGSNLLLEKITRMEMSEGVPMEAWVAMGLQDKEGTPPGQYNGYNLSVYSKNNFDYQTTKAECINSIKESITNFISQPKSALSFFTRKIAGQWCAPDYETLRSGLVKQSNISFIVNDVLASSLTSFLRSFLNIFQTWILFGVICHILLCKNKTEYEWIFALIFIGGFLFHLFWESGSRYAFPYYILLLPYSCMGIDVLERNIEHSIMKRKNLPPCTRYFFITLLVPLILLCLLPYTSILRASKLYNHEESLINEKMLKNGFYQIKAYCGDELYLTEREGSVLIMREETEKPLFSLYANPTTYIIRFQPSNNVLDLLQNGSVYVSSSDYPIEWTIRQANDQQFYIMIGTETALEYSLEDWSVKTAPFEEGNSQQLWNIIPQ